jgi:hypothetical protein
MYASRVHNYKLLCMGMQVGLAMFRGAVSFWRCMGFATANPYGVGEMLEQDTFLRSI